MVLRAKSVGYEAFIIKARIGWSLTFIDNISGISPTVIFGNKIQKFFLVTSDVTSDIWIVTSYVTDTSPVTKKFFWILFPKITVGDIPEMLSIKVNLFKILENL